jgi:hypothetical protein
VKIVAEIKSVKTDGDALTIEVAGKGRRDPGWFPRKMQSLTVRDSEIARASFRVGRDVEITITPA